MDETSLKYYLERYPCREIPTRSGEPVTQFITCPARLAFAFLDKPRKLLNGKEMYTASLIIPPAANLEIPQRIYVTVATQRFGANWQQMSLKSAVKPQAKLHGKYEGFGETGFYFDTSSKFAPPVFDQQKRPMSTAPGKGVYSGMWVLAWLRVYAYPPPGQPMINPGIGFGLVALQKLADDDQFQAVDRSEAFDVVVHEPSASSTAGPAQPPGQITGWGA